MSFTMNKDVLVVRHNIWPMNCELWMAPSTIIHAVDCDIHTDFPGQSTTGIYP
jgi:hypothetical protein